MVSCARSSGLMSSGGAKIWSGASWSQQASGASSRRYRRCSPRPLRQRRSDLCPLRFRRGADRRCAHRRAAGGLDRIADRPRARAPDGQRLGVRAARLSLHLDDARGGDRRVSRFGQDRRWCRRPDKPSRLPASRSLPSRERPARLLGWRARSRLSLVRPSHSRARRRRTQSAVQRRSATAIADTPRDLQHTIAAVARFRCRLPSQPAAQGARKFRPCRNLRRSNQESRQRSQPRANQVPLLLRWPCPDWGLLRFPPVGPAT